jgi:mannose/fructose/N-acetylgalactosamine-specific phosphotransferase system component IIC
VELVWAALAGTVVYLDTTAIAQIMICQPIIACPLWGVIVGRPELGLFFGVIFQFIWLGNLQIGAARFAEGNIGAFVATALAAFVPPQSNGEPAWIVLALAFAVGLIAAQFGSGLAPFVRRIVGKIVPAYVLAASEGNENRMRALFLRAIAIHVASGFLFSIAFLFGGRQLFRYVLGDFYLAGINDSLAGATDPLLSGLWPAALGAGAAIAILMLLRRAWLVWFAVPAVIIFAVSALWIA